MVEGNEAQVEWFADVFRRIVDDVERALVGKRDVVELAVACLLSQGHLLIEDVPGNGKSTLARALARTILGTQARIQFTPDVSPSDITGEAVWDDKLDRYRFHPGPVFNTLVLADEINRAMPRTQSALLEVMEEGSVTLRGQTKQIGPPFMVIATQNPVDHNGTFDLPEAQLDRFLMCTTIGYPDEASTVRLMGEAAVRDRATKVTPLLNAQTLAEALSVSDSIAVPEDVLRFVYAIADATRQSASLKVGLSTRGCLSYVRAIKTWAASRGRTEVTRDDVVHLVHPVIDHRLSVLPAAVERGETVAGEMDRILAAMLVTS